MREHGKKHERGQSLVEFALSLPILIIILSGMIDIGRVYFAYIFLEEAAAEAALYISLNPDCAVDDGGACVDPNNAEWRANNSGSRQGIAQTVTIDSGDTIPAIGEVVEVEATMTFSFVTPFVTALMENIDPDSGGLLQLRVVATHLVITE